RTFLAATQFTLALGAFAVQPSLSTGIVLSAVLCGAVTHTPGILALAMVGVASAATALWVDAPVSTVVTLIILYGLSVVVGYLFLQRLQEKRRHRSTVEQLEQAQKRIAAFAETTRDLAASRERQRLTEELHDTLGHALVGTLLQLKIARKLMAADTGAAKARLELVEGNLKDTLEQDRAALRRGTQRRSQLPLPYALDYLIADCRAAGGPDVELALVPDEEAVSDVSP